MGAKNYDFSGYVTRNDLECSDGRTIRRNAFKDNDGKTVPLVFMHNHSDIGNVIGKVLLENRDDGVYGYAFCNDTENGRNAREIVMHGDVDRFSIWANNLVQRGGDVLHGMIREVSLVLSGANPGAYIDFPIIEHSGEMIDDEAIIYAADKLELMHSDKEEEPQKNEDENVEKETDKEEEKKDMALQHADEDEDKTVKDVFDSMTEEQKNVVYFMIGQALEDADNYDESEDDEVKHNVFESDVNNGGQENYLSHDEMTTIINDAKKFGSLKESFLEHADEYGIEYIDYLFPDAKTINNTPEFIQRDTGWVSIVMNGVHHTPFSRVKSIFANITEDEARAKGYFKGKLKKNEVFALLKRSTPPQTIYKKQKLDRDDVIDITDFDVVAWLKSEMRHMLDEEIARAILIGDGRDPADDDKISEEHIRPIAKDSELYSIKVKVGSTDPDDFIENAIRYRKWYRGSGTPILFTTEDMLTEMLLLKNPQTGEFLYKSEAELATTLRVSRIVTVEVMEGQKIDNADLLGIIVNLNDYNVGADKGGAISMFDDFDIDYNQMKYLIETRCSGAMVKPYGAMVLTSATGETTKANPRDYYEDRSSGETGDTGSTGGTGSTGDTGDTGSQG